MNQSTRRTWPVVLLVTLWIAVLMSGCGPQPAAEQTAPAAPAAFLPGFVVETEDLASVIEQPDLVLLDARTPELYQEAHIPGAVNVPNQDLRDSETAAATGFPITAEKAAQVFGEAGVDADTRVIVYDAGDGRGATGVWNCWIIRAGDISLGPCGWKGRIVYEDYECYNCHKIGGKGGVKRRGPELGNVGSLITAEAIKGEILDPRASLSEGFEEEYDKVTMPDDFGQRMSQEQMNALVAYLNTLKDASVQSPKALFAGTRRANEGPWYEIPLEFQRVMPRAWWTDPQIIAEGKAIYEGATKSDVVCAACHGRDGVPILTGAADFRNADLVESMSEVYWYWRIAAGVSGTAMTAWGEKMTPEDIWKVMAYENTFAYGGEPTEHPAKFRPPPSQ